jgi:methylase of polypeptide subunit release factors
MSLMSSTDDALLALLRALHRRDYRFVTPTPATHARVLARPDRRRARSLTDVLGWSLPFEPGLLDREIEDLLRAGGAAEETPDGLKSLFRVSSLEDGLYLHSAYPTEAEDAVFFGPDSYRFAAFIAEQLKPPIPDPIHIVDIGAGSGVGALTATRLRPKARLTLTDVNPQALRLARINAAFAGVEVETLETDGLQAVEDPLDLALANPPYIADDGGRDYRDGGDMHGARLSLDLAREAAERLAPGGRLLLYTGTAIVDGRDALREALEPAMAQAGCSLAYREIDPDVFGEELDKPAYADVDRIAVVGAVAVKSAG